jgi:transcriptional regulator with XRE-family HTH domain
MQTKPASVERALAGTSSNALLSGPGVFIERASSQFQSIMPTEMPPEWEDREDREFSVEEHVRQGIAWQVRINREERGLRQGDLAKLMKTGQSAVSRIEDPHGGDLTLSTLFKAAHAFDCAVIVSFVSYAQFASSVSDLRSERQLACSYADDRKPSVWRRVVGALGP